MARHYASWRLVFTFLATLAATVTSGQFATAQYTWNQDSDTAGDWSDPDRWTGNEPTGFPDAADATVTIEAPTTTQGLSGPNGYRLSIPNNVTVGHLTIDNDGYANTYRTFFGNNAGHLKFQSTSGPATYTETFGSNSGTTSAQYQFDAVVELISDLTITQNNYPGFNSGTIFHNLVSGASDRTLTKTGQGGIQFEYRNPLPGIEIPFQGQVVINQGDIRLLTTSPFSNVRGLTVNPGGQLKLADNAQNLNNANWSLAPASGEDPAAVLTLNGAGKVSGNNPEGALRFAQGNAGLAATSWDSPIVLQSDSVISVAPNAAAFNTATISSIVSGPGGLTKHGTGTLILNQPNYDGDTTVLPGGILRIDTATLSDAADVFLNTVLVGEILVKGILNLNFSGTNDVRSLVLGGEAQEPGIYNASNSEGLITGTGALNVLPLPGTPGDHNGDEVVDILDYVIWRAGDPTGTNDPAGYTDWAANYGNPPGSGNGSSNSGVSAAVPEPATCLLTLLAASLGAMRRRR